MKTNSTEVAIVTGGASGIGRALARALAARGTHVVVADIAAQAAEEVAAAIRDRGGKARSHAVDVTSQTSFADMAQATLERDGRVDLLFNNAGVGLGGEVRDLDAGDWRRVLEVNLQGVIHGILAVYPIMIRQGRGHIVNTASGAGLVPVPVLVPYATSKWAVVGLSTSLRAEAAPLGVRVSVVCPGYIDTPIVDTSKMVGARQDIAKLLYPGRPMPPDRCAEIVLRGVRKNKAIIPVTGLVHLYWRLYRLAPGIAAPIGRALMGKFNRHRLQGGEREIAPSRAG